MTALLNTEQVRQAEQAVIDAGVSEDELMLRAGNAIAEQIDATHGHPGEAIILVGPGKNGGDGVVIAARLNELDWTVSVWAWNRDGIADAPVEAGTSQSIHWVESNEEASTAIQNADVVVDAVFGVSGRADLPSEVIEIFRNIEQVRSDRHIDVWAVDIPSGVDCDTGDVADDALAVDITAMIASPKIGAYRFPAAKHTGYLSYIDIGIGELEGISSDTPRLIGALDARSIIPTRRTGIHKRTAGQLMVIGGAPNYFGAPRLAGEAGLRSGAGIVSIAAPASIVGSIATAVPELTFVPLPVSEHSTVARRMNSIIREQFESTDAFVIGPGLGTDAPIPDFLGLLLGFDQSTRQSIGFGSASDSSPAEPFTGRAVIDADALNWLSTQESWWEPLSSAELVLTPHPGEMARLLGIERSEVEADPWTHAREAASKFGQVVVLKFGHTVVATPDGRLAVADQAPPSLATAGTGDVLAGIIGTFLSQGCDAESAAIAGIVLGLRATALAEEASGTIGITATDIIRSIPSARDEIMHARTRFE